MNSTFILASSSPRRKELFSMFDIPFEIIPSQEEENAHGVPSQMVLQLARLKCESVARQYPDRFVLGSDTLVALDENVLGKPTNKEDALNMLRQLNGKWHYVYTGVCIYSPKNKKYYCEYEATKVHFCNMTDSDLSRYIETGEPFGKAGAYAVQGRGGAMVDKIEGSSSNVIGLPMALTRKLLSQSGAVENWLK